MVSPQFNIDTGGIAVMVEIWVLLAVSTAQAQEYLSLTYQASITVMDPVPLVCPLFCCMHARMPST